MRTNDIVRLLAVLIWMSLPLLIALTLSGVGRGSEMRPAEPPPHTLTERFAYSNYITDIELIRRVEMASYSSDTHFLLILHTLIYVESSYLPDAQSVDGRAVGLMQVTGPAVQDAAEFCGITVPPRTDLFIPEINVLLGSCYLGYLLDRYPDDWYSVLVAYHGGGAAARRLQEGKLLGRRTANYALKVIYLTSMNRKKFYATDSK